MVHLRIVSPPDRTERALRVLAEAPAVINVVHLPRAARKPPGDVLLCDVAREDASVVIADLRALGLADVGTIAVEAIESSVSRAAAAAERAAKGDPADAVVWEAVEARTSDESKLSATYVVFIVLAALIAVCGVLLDSAILVVGAMVVGPEFGPLAGLCVAVATGRRTAAIRSGGALALGMLLAVAAALLTALVLKATGLVPDGFDPDTGLADTISRPDFYAFFVALCAGIAGMLSLTTAKSGALVGVLISVTTIPAAANIGVGSALGDGSEALGSLGQLSINLATLIAVGVLTLHAQRRAYARRRSRHAQARGAEEMGEPARAG